MAVHERGSRKDSMTETRRSSFLPPPFTGPGLQSHSSSSPSPPTPPVSSKLQRLWVKDKGLVWILLSQAFGVLMNGTTRALEENGKGMDPFQILLARMSLTLLLASGYMWYKNTPDFPLGKPEVRGLLMARGFGGFFGVFGMYYSLQYLPLAEATVITFLAPGLACWACSILIHEPFGRLEKFACLVSLLGVVLIARPSTIFAASNSGNSTVDDDATPSQRLKGTGVGLVGVLGAASAYTTIRWIGKRAHPLISVNYFAAWCTLISVIAQFTIPGVTFSLPADLRQWGLLVFLGVCGFAMQFLLAAALSYEKSSRATNIAYMQMIFAIAFDKIVFGHSPDLTSIAGSSLILGSALCVATMASTGKPDYKALDDASPEHHDQSRQGLMTADVELANVPEGPERC
ncbi:hypothetical protein K470DRAFT_261589 [Piedraia hortae CBS 480.64]|uniref:EamA domain-containing protein n=1 Tax=Piedraia hortae CBS 480.64 TaxID=1314780 RepID=A0A6A7C9B5_9PEZI|nr:hypothetical protein K470DRAFT_261589 [Piedraia hortae CBS 480.64]